VRYVRRADGRAAIADDMPPTVRAVHANRRRNDGLALSCPCRECVRHRGAVRGIASADGRTLVVEPA
jgi:hypothetical protein